MVLILLKSLVGGMAMQKAATIKFQRPDLISTSEISAPIAVNPPLGFFPTVELPKVGELMLASFPTNESNFTSSIAPNSWWMGEKYDGVRFCWNPEYKSAYTRAGKSISLLPSIISSLPNGFIDGEFWFGRGQFNLIYSLCGNSLPNVMWDSLRMVAFDVPSSDTQSLPFEARYELLLSKINSKDPITIVAPRVMCKSTPHLNSFIGSIIDNGGEGAIVRKIKSMYENGRNTSLYKLKTASEDREALVVSVDHDSISIKLPEGNIITVPMERVEVRVREGEIVSFTGSRSSRAMEPSNVFVFRVRYDLSWPDVLLLSFKDSHYYEGFKKKPTWYWTKENIHSYILQFAKKLNLDPLMPTTWHNQQFLKSKGVRAMIRKFKDVKKAIQALFPEINTNTDDFIPYGHWESAENRRLFFENFAKENSFDHNLADNWYSQPREKILSIKGARSVMYYHNNSVARALVDLFPDIGLQKSKFVRWSWTYSGRRKAFFEKFAQDRGFDPLNPSHWYQQSKAPILAKKEAPIVLSYHKGSLVHALIDLFPDIGLEKEKLRQQHAWSNVGNRRIFFENYAMKNGFDPLIPSNWYPQSREEILRVKGAKRVISYHKDSVTQALIDLFPEIGFQKIYFKNWINSIANRRRVFERYAKLSGFDPQSAEEWYNQSTAAIATSEEGAIVLVHYSNSLPQALLDLFPNIGLERSRFVAQCEWDSQTIRRMFFENLAKQHEFNPLVPSNWYNPLHKQLIKASLDLKKVIRYHNNSVIQALSDLFPEIRLDKSKFYLWSLKSTVNRRRFFEDYAKENQFNPNIPDNWYRQQNLSSVEGLSSVLKYYESLPHALMELFPNIGLEKTKLRALVPSKWSTPGNRRIFFEEYAKQNNFDPLSPANWYSQPLAQVMGLKGARRVLYYHHNSLTTALVDLFPDIGLEKEKFVQWVNSSNGRRQFFERYATQNAFDATDPKKWYIQAKEKVSAFEEGGVAVLSLFNNNLASALVDAFPNIGLCKSRFVRTSEWDDISVRRELFVKIARDIGFDPLQPVNWYSATLKQKLLSYQDVKRVIRYHGNNLVQAAMDLFPGIGLQKSKFYKWSLHFIEHRRQFFEDYAAGKGFDCYIPDNWYTQRDQIMATQDISIVLSYHNNLLPQALTDLFPNIGLDRAKLRLRSKWHNLDTRKKFFITYATSNSFDPLDPQNWYLQSRKDIISVKDANNVLLHYGGSISSALLDCFPNIGLNELKFAWKKKNWKHTANRRKFFAKYAEINRFDARNANDWYSQSSSKIMAAEGAHGVVSYHNNSLVQALLDLFPNIGLSKPILSSKYL